MNVRKEERLVYPKVVNKAKNISGVIDMAVRFDGATDTAVMSFENMRVESGTGYDLELVDVVFTWTE